MTTVPSKHHHRVQTASLSCRDPHECVYCHEISKPGESMLILHNDVEKKHFAMHTSCAKLVDIDLTLASYATIDNVPGFSRLPIYEKAKWINLMVDKYRDIADKHAVEKIPIAGEGTPVRSPRSAMLHALQEEQQEKEKLTYVKEEDRTILTGKYGEDKTKEHLRPKDKEIEEILRSDTQEEKAI